MQEGTKLDRLELCDLMIACTVIQGEAKEEGNRYKAEKWRRIHSKLQAMLNEMNEQSAV